jgi:hypothetical protein
MTFAIHFIYKGLKKCYDIETNLDLECMQLYYVERYIKRMGYFPFDCIIDVQPCVHIDRIADLKDSTIHLTDDSVRPGEINNDNNLKNK